MLNVIALVSESAQVSTTELLAVSAALQKQAVRDLSPIWGIHATIDPFASLDDVPAGYWPLIVVDQLASGDKGIHGQRDGQPVALVQYEADWSMSASHECLEMLVDPWGCRLVPGDSLSGDGTRVDYLVEICDPCQDRSFAYRVNERLVSNFYTPNYFDPSGATGARYDFTGVLTRPRQVLEGGYLSWRDPATNHLHRADCIDGEIWSFDLGEVPTNTFSLRSVIDSTHGKGKRIGRLRVAPNRVRRPRGGGHSRQASALRHRLAEQFTSLSSRKLSSRNK